MAQGVRGGSQNSRKHSVRGTLYYMSTTLTIRIAADEREALIRRATQRGLTVSELVRDILREGLAERSMSAKAGHLKGRLRIKRTAAVSWRRQIREHNWRR